mgnify:FL=1
MEDEKIIGLYWERSEDAIAETASKYGRLFFRIADNILSDQEDSEECVNDTYLGLWNAIPDARPSPFAAFAGRITRNLALKKYEYRSAAKRNPQAIRSFEELRECVSGRTSVENKVEERRIEQLIDAFLWQQREETRTVFLRRYWYVDSISVIADRYGMKENTVKSILFRTREKLRKFLGEEGIAV